MPRIKKTTSPTTQADMAAVAKGWVAQAVLPEPLLKPMGYQWTFDPSVKDGLSVEVKCESFGTIIKLLNTSPACCITRDAARSLGQALIEAADLAEKLDPSIGLKGN